jgi:hypothetical protein
VNLHTKSCLDTIIHKTKTSYIYKTEGVSSSDSECCFFRPPTTTQANSVICNQTVLVSDCTRKWTERWKPSHIYCIIYDSSFHSSIHCLVLIRTIFNFLFLFCWTENWSLNLVFVCTSIPKETALLNRCCLLGSCLVDTSSSTLCCSAKEAVGGAEVHIIGHGGS